ncbi:hypothetical protein M422DRAFT_261732 [Sphaerobolus stellatus SS14]|uniref:Heme haloperoxidase family profile domain-containing protein n=1 Tax=Sphaerobolus stellatus (strain SS14) TaxID=990650 RepID=A0A0C9VEG7_SPHS4|nr:hypothetical protein M422DRAFT_261732 [Sphaerobolus stellatus SS14]
MPSYLLALLALQTIASPHCQHLAGLSERKLEKLLPGPSSVTPPPPGPLKDTSVKLVNDKAHPWMPLCKGYGMENGIVVALAYGSLLVDGNPLTNLVSIGAKSPATGPDPSKPADVGGLNGNNSIEGDASFTRDDFEFGDNHSFNNKLFDQISNRFGGGKYNLTVPGEYRFYRVQQSIVQNPHFSFTTPRFITAYREISFPFIFFVDGRKADGQLNLKDTLGFFPESRFPDDFRRIDGTNSSDLANNAATIMFNAHPIEPGRNDGKVNKFTVDTKSAAFDDPCGLYTSLVDVAIGRYPNPQDVLRKNLNANLGFLYQPFQGCPQRFPFGK